MALIRWEPVRELASLQGEMNRLFSTLGDGSGGDAVASSRWIPAMDLTEEEGHYVLHADLPGMKEDDVAIEMENSVLSISGKREHERASDAKGYYRVERATGAFSRSLTLPEGVDPDGITASFTDGVLELRIPKPEQRKPHRVRISSSREPETIEA